MPLSSASAVVPLELLVPRRNKVLPLLRVDLRILSLERSDFLPDVGSSVHDRKHSKSAH